MFKFSRLLRPASFSNLTKSILRQQNPNQQQSPDPSAAPIIYEAKHTYGQAGILNTVIENINTDIHFKTIWEDHALLKLHSHHPALNNYLDFTEEEKHCYLKDTALPGTLKSIEKGLIIAEIPEYYSLNLVNRGSIGFITSEVSSKLCGNVNVKLLDEGSKFAAKKIKAEFFETHINKGGFEISTFLESAQFYLTSKDINVNVKRFGISSTADFDVEKGKMDFGSIYIGNYGPGKVQQKARNKVVNVSNEMQSVEKICEELGHVIKEGNYLGIVADELKLDVGHMQGPAVIRVDQGDINLISYEGEQFLVKVNEGNIVLNLSNCAEGLVSLNQGNLKLMVDVKFEVNLYSYREKKYIGEEFVPGRPVVLLDLGENVKLTLERSERKSIFERFSRLKQQQQ